MENYSNSIEEDKMLIVIAPPSVSNKYYKEVYDQIVTFDIAYAKSILNKDNVIVVADAPTYKYLKKHLPEDILLESKLADIWLRDCSMVMPYAPVQFRYAAAAQGGKQADADWVQTKFNRFIDGYDIQYKGTELILDGGNLVDNYKGKIVVTDRFLEDNNLSYTQGKKELQELLGATEVAIVPNDDPEGLAHVDGMLMFIDDNTIALNKYTEKDFRQDVIDELKTAFPNIKIIELDTEFDTSVWDENFGSSCGIHTNATVTHNYIYMPIFGSSTDQNAIDLVQQNSSNTVVPIDASNVCFMGGSVRCLSWQVVGSNAEKLIKAARE
ncbi:MAG: agmatine deiminase family protein [Aureispira sp.]|nr:agmatine deiminase family protein [Aureispira sp.]